MSRGVSRGVTCESAVRQRLLETAHGLNATRRSRLTTKRSCEKIIRARASQLCRGNALRAKAAQSNPSRPQGEWCRRAMVRHSLNTKSIDLQTLPPAKLQQARGGRKRQLAGPATAWLKVAGNREAQASSVASRAMTQSTASFD